MEIKTLGDLTGIDIISGDLDTLVKQAKQWFIEKGDVEQIQLHFFIKDSAISWGYARCIAVTSVVCNQAELGRIMSNITDAYHNRMQQLSNEVDVLYTGHILLASFSPFERKGVLEAVDDSLLVNNAQLAGRTVVTTFPVWPGRVVPPQVLQSSVTMCLPPKYNRARPVEADECLVWHDETGKELCRINRSTGLVLNCDKWLKLDFEV